MFLKYNIDKIDDSGGIPVELKNLRTFQTIVDQGSYQKAADCLDYWREAGLFSQGESPAPQKEATPAVPAAESPRTPGPESAPAATKGDAQAFIGRSVSSLIAAIGQPISRDYAPSCMGSGEDGELVYNGFTVYTYREGSVETVQDVI